VAWLHGVALRARARIGNLPAVSSREDGRVERARRETVAAWELERGSACRAYVLGPKATSGYSLVAASGYTSDPATSQCKQGEQVESAAKTQDKW
jgi:hypothetical protein